MNVQLGGLAFCKLLNRLNEAKFSPTDKRFFVGVALNCELGKGWSMELLTAGLEGLTAIV